MPTRERAIISRPQYEEAYHCARAVYTGAMRLKAAQSRLGQMGMKSNSAADFVYIFKHMLAGEIYKRAMSAEATEDFILWIKRDYGETEFRNALSALRLHIPYNGGAMHRHWALLSRYGVEQDRPKVMEDLPPAVRILPMSPEESYNYTIEEMQSKFFLIELPQRSGRYRYKTALDTPKGSVVLFQYASRIIASATYFRKEKFPETDRWGYVGAMIFDPASIRVFEPLSAEVLKKIWPEVDRFSHIKFDLAPAGLRELQAMQVGVKDPAIDDNAADDDGDYIPNGTDGREKVSRQIRLRRGQRKFRDALRKRYHNRCVVTNCAIVALLEAAHIAAYPSKVFTQRPAGWSGSADFTAGNKQSACFR